MFNTHVSDSSQSATLTGAILLYGGDARTGQGGSFATVHLVETINQRPEIMPGRPMMEADLVTIASNLAAAKEAITTTWLDPSMLARGADRMIWWTPPARRPMFFKESNLVKSTFNGNAVCPVPGLVWMAMPGNGLYVYAVKGKDRPVTGTQLFQAPFFNIWGRGKVCVGSAALPPEGEQSNPLEWEKVIFGSYFTHPNFSEANRLVKGISPSNFWKQMVEAPPAEFPENRLVKLPLTVADLLERTLLDTLRNLPVPKGEF